MKTEHMKKKLIYTSIAVFLYVLCILVSVNNTFILRFCDVRSTVYTDYGKEQVNELNTAMQKYIGSSLITFGKSEAVQALADFPYLRMDSCEIRYPDRLVLTVTERKEMFCAEQNGRYAIVADDGTVLCERQDNVNREDGAANIRLTDFSIEYEVGKNVLGSTAGSAFGVVLEVIAAAEAQFGNMRAEVVSVQYTSGVYIWQLCSGGRIRLAAESSEDAAGSADAESPDYAGRFLSALQSFYALSEQDKVTFDILC